jgi:hypothetical protein
MRTRVGVKIEYDDLFSSGVWNSIPRRFQTFGMSAGILILNVESTHQHGSVMYSPTTNGTLCGHHTYERRT